MAVAPAELTANYRINLEFIPQDLAKAKELLVESAKQGEQKAANAALLERTKGNAKLETADALSQNKIKNKRLEMLASMSLAEERERLKSIKGQESWSARMTKSLDSVALSVKGFAAAWAIAQVSSMVRGSLSLAGGMQDLASGVQLTTQQYFALTSALRDAGVQAEKIDPMFTRLNDLISGGATDKQATILSRLGIDATGMTNVQLMDTLLSRINSKLITQAELGEIVGTRIVPAWNRLANEVSGVNEANSRYVFPLKDDDIQKLDTFSQQWSTFWTVVNINAGGYIVKITDAIAKQKELNNLELIRFGYRNTNFPLVGSGLESGLAPKEMQGPLISDAGLSANLRMLADETERRLRAEKEIAKLKQDALDERIISQMERGTEALERALARLAVVKGSRQSGLGIREGRGGGGLGGLFQEGAAAERATPDALSFFDRLEKFAASDTWKTINAGGQAFTNILSMQGQLVQNQVDALQNLMGMERERWRERSEHLRNAGLESSATYRNEQREFERIDKARQKKMQQLQSKAFEVNKRSQIASTIMSTAAATMNALQTKPLLPVGLIMAALVAAQGGVQLSMIAGQKNPHQGFAFGGYVPGGGLSDDTPINVTGGEFVATRDATRRNRKALEYANAGGDLQGSGGITIQIMGDVIGSDYWVEQRLLPQLQKALDRGHKLRIAA